MQFCRKTRLKNLFFWRFKAFAVKPLNTRQLSRYSRYSASTIMTPNCKEFRFGDYDIIGFDLDGTLLRYNLQEMVPLVYNLLRQYLVAQKGYPPSLLQKTLDKDFLQKGLILDNENGNILKLSSDATILRATHGTSPLMIEQIIEKYGVERKWNVSLEFFKDPLSTWNGPLTEKLRTLLDCFDMAASLVFGQAVDLIDAKTKGSLATPYKVWPDIQDSLIEIYSRENFSNGRSGYFNALRANPERFLVKTNPKVIQWLQDLRAGGKAIFLLTGSNIDFANLTASYALGKNWQELFDFVICFAKKPGFFTMQRPFLRIVEKAEIVGSEISITENLALNSAYSQGNWVQLRRTLCAKLNKKVEKVRSLYVGDNLIQDVYAPFKQNGLDVVALCEELLVDEKNPTSGYEFRDFVASKLWGSYFCVDNEPTLWADIIAKHSQLCIPMVDAVADKPPTYKFQCTNACYFPCAPSALT